MPTTGTQTPIVTGQNIADGGTYTSALINLAGHYGTTITAQLSIGGTAPSTAPALRIEYSPDGGTTWQAVLRGVAGNIAGQTYEFSFKIEAEIPTVRLVSTGNTGAAVTLSAQRYTLTGL